MNLVVNARDAVESGGRILVTLEQIDDEEIGIALQIDDDGPGIPEDAREDVFRPFRRLDESRNPETGGSGLGLAIARDIARAHGGDIVLDVSPHGGLRARVRLPL